MCDSMTSDGDRKVVLQVQLPSHQTMLCLASATDKAMLQSRGKHSVALQEFNPANARGKATIMDFMGRRKLRRNSLL